MTDSAEIIAFILAQYDVDEQSARADLDTYEVAVFAEQILRDIASKRLVVKEHNPAAWSNTNQNRYCPSCAEDTYDPHRPYERVLAPCRTLRLLAEPFASRDGYKDEWSISGG